MNFEKLHKKLRDGDSLTNQELKYLLFKSNKIREALMSTGDVFYVAFKEANRIYIQVGDYLRARGVEIDA